MRIYVAIILIIILTLPLVQAQQIVLVKRRRPSLKYVFKEGETLKLKRKENQEVTEGTWQYAGENKIEINGQVIALRDIYWLSTAKKEKGIWLLRKGQDMFIAVGLGFLLVSQTNRLIDPDKFKKENKEFQYSAALVSGGLICRGLDRTIRKRKVRVGSRFGIYLIGSSS